MLKLCRVTKVNVFFLVLVCVFNFTNFNLFKFSFAILEKGLLVTNGFTDQSACRLPAAHSAKWLLSRGVLLKKFLTPDKERSSLKNVYNCNGLCLPFFF